MTTISSAELKPVLDTLKKHFKNNNIRYNDIAEATGRCLATIQKMMNSESMTLKQLSELCALSGLTFSELIKMSDDEAQLPSYMTVEQDKALSEDPALRMYMMELFLRGHSPERIAELYNISPASTVIYLRQLEKLGLIRIGLNNSFTWLIKPTFNIRPTGKMQKVVGQRALRDLAKQVLERYSKDSKAFFNVHFLTLSEQQYETLRKELNNVFLRYTTLSRGQTATEEGMKNYGFVLIGDQYELLETKALKEAP